MASLLSKSRPKIRFAVTCSGNWRGYTANWEIDNGHLFLVGISGRLQSDGLDPLAALFPEQSLPILASWYSGSLCIPCGKPVAGKRWIYGIAYDDHIQIEVVLGAVVHIEEGLGPSPAFVSGLRAGGLLSLLKTN